MLSSTASFLILICVLVLQTPRTCVSLPFKSRGSDGEKEDKDGPAISVRGAAAALSSKASSHTNPIVDEFFQTLSFDFESESSIALKKEIQILTQTTSLKTFLTETRRQLHKHPELMYQEEFTSDTIQAALKELDIEFTSGWSKNTRQEDIPGPGGYGVVADIGSGNGPCIILRADMDALPIEEQTHNVNKFKSTQRGKMHACGHDGHTTMLLGAAAILKQLEDSIQGTVRLMFQPAEEGGAGAKRMVEEGVIDMEPKAQYAFGMHVWPQLPSKTIASSKGPLLAAVEVFEVHLSGKGGHAAMPHLTIDPIVAASSAVLNLQTIISRTLSPLESGVVSVTQLTAGESFNVIPASAIIKGTIRALSVENLISLRDRVEHIIQSNAELHHCNATIRYMPDAYPPTVNDPTLFDNFSKHVGSLVSKEGIVRDIVPTMGGEDFSFLAQAIPSTFFLLGQGTGQDAEHQLPATDFGLHHPQFALDEDVMPTGVELHVNLALRALKKLSVDSLASGDSVDALEL